MPTREQIIRQYGGLENVPEYLRRGFAMQDREQERRDEQRRMAEAREEAERERIKALRRPPRNVRLEGRKVTWEPPETADELPPAGYWVSECYKGSWTRHGDYLLPHVREAVLFGEGPASVETWYHQMALGEGYSARAVPVDDSPETGPAAGGPTEETPPPAAGLSRMDRIVAAVRTYTGRRTRSGAPWVRPLRKHAGMPDITGRERDEAHRQAEGG